MVGFCHGGNVPAGHHQHGHHDNDHDDDNDDDDDDDDEDDDDDDGDDDDGCHPFCWRLPFASELSLPRSPCAALCSQYQGGRSSTP